MSSIRPIAPHSFRPTPSASARSYGDRKSRRHLVRRLAQAVALGAILLTAATVPGVRAATPVKIVAFGDSLTAGYGLPEKEGFVPRLQAALTAKGLAAEVANAGVSGNTASDGLARLDWSAPPGTDAVILELGANDMLRGIDTKLTRDVLGSILRRLGERHIAVLLCGMRAAPNLGPDYSHAFNRIFPELAAEYGVPLYPFFLDGVASDLKLLLPDGLHPNAAGVDVMVQRMLPAVEALIAHVLAQKPR